MSAAAEVGDSVSPHPNYPDGFRPRRGLNWLCIGLTYASFYMCRYNLPIASEHICREFNFTNAQFGLILTAHSVCYAMGQFINGLFTDRLGGKTALMIGAVSTILLNIAFGLASTTGILGLFIFIRAVDGYVQSFGAPGMIKINTAWFAKSERGRFAGIFGFMIQLGNVSINRLGPALLAGSLLGFVFGPLHWRYLFYVPAAIATFCVTLLAIFVTNTPDAAGWPGVVPDDTGALSKATDAEEEPLPLAYVLKTILSNRTVWVIALAYACTGAVRSGLNNWFPKYLKEVHNIDAKSPEFATVAILLPIVAVFGSYISGYISDVFFKGKRTPVAAVLYFMETTVILSGTLFSTPFAMSAFLVAISFTANSTHSILGTAAAMDIGGKKMAGFASGVIDSFQYIGAALAGYPLGLLIDKYKWGAWLPSLATFGLLGGCMMVFLTVRQKQQAIAAGPAAENV